MPYDFYTLITPDKLDAMRHEVSQEDLTDLVVRSQRDADRGIHRARGAPVPLKRTVIDPDLAAYIRANALARDAIKTNFTDDEIARMFTANWLKRRDDKPDGV